MKGTCDSAVYNGAVLELDRDGLVVQLHQKPNQFFFSIINFELHEYHSKKNPIAAKNFPGKQLGKILRKVSQTKMEDIPDELHCGERDES